MKQATKKRSEMTELEKITFDFEKKKQELELKYFWYNQIGIKPAHSGSKLFGKLTLSFDVNTLAEGKKIADFFPIKSSGLIRSAIDQTETGSPYYIEFKTWSFSGEKHVTIHFETETEYIDIKVPFTCYPSYLFTGTEYQLEGKERDSAILHKQRTTYSVPYFSGFDSMKFAFGSVKNYIKPENATAELLEEFEKTIFQTT